MHSKGKIINHALGLICKLYNADKNIVLNGVNRKSATIKSKRMFMYYLYYYLEINHLGMKKHFKTLSHPTSIHHVKRFKFEVENNEITKNKFDVFLSKMKNYSIYGGGFYEKRIEMKKTIKAIKMIKGFEDYTYELTDGEFLLVDKLIRGLNVKIGKSKAVTSTVICKSLNITSPRLRKLINYIRTTNQLPGLCSSKNGYFVAENLEEIEDYIISLKQRIKSQVDVLNSIEQQTVLWGGSGQLSLFE